MRRAGFLGHLGLILGPGAAAVAALSAWNVVHVMLGSQRYRGEFPRAAELLIICLAAYAPLVLVPLAAVSMILAVVARAPLGWIGKAETEGRSWMRAAHIAAASAIAALLLGIGVVAPRSLAGAALGESAFLDLAIAALVAAGVGWLGYRLGIGERRSRAPLVRLGYVTRAVAGLAVALLLWQIARDHLGGRSRSLVDLILALPAAIAGLLLALRLGPAARAVSSWIALLRRAGRRSPWARRVLLLVLGGGFLVLIGVEVWAHRDALPRGGSAAPDRPNVILIVIDALRADHVGAYGSTRARTPGIDALAADGVRFEQVYAASSWTAPCTASLLTALHPGSHGLASYRGSIRDEAVSVASIFRRAGYATAGFAANPLLSEKYGFGSGFDLWEEEVGASRLRNHSTAPVHATLALLRLWTPPDRFPRAEEIVRRAIGWIDRRGAPFFVYLHLMDTHDPYDPPPPYDTLYGGATRSDLRMRIGTLNSIMMGTLPVGPDDFERMEALYDGAVTYADAQVGRLRDELARRGLDRETLVVVTADHGEEFLDHGDLEHTRTLYEEIVRVPLVIAGPRIAAGQVQAGPVRQVDVAPTILEAAGLSFSTKIEGASLWRSISASEPLAPREAFMELIDSGFRSPWHSARGLRQGNLKLIEHSIHGDQDGPWQWQIHDLAEDPAERRDLAASRPAETAALRERLDAWGRRPLAARRGQPPPDEEVTRRLRSLGYID